MNIDDILLLVTMIVSCLCYIIYKILDGREK